MITKAASRRTIASLLLLAMGVMVARASQPPLTGGEFTVNRSTIDAGGGAVSGGQFTLRGTIGQYDTNQVGRPDYSVRAGFWTYPDSLFRDGFESNNR